MAGKSREVDPRVVARREARIRMLLNQLALTQEELDIEVAEACADGVPLRMIAPWLETTHTTVAAWRERGIEASHRRSGGAAQQRGERGQVS